MGKLSTGIREAINMFGAEIIKTERLFAVLLDFQAFEFNAVRTVLRAMINGGFTAKMYDMYIGREAVDNAHLQAIVYQVALQGFNQEFAKYVVQSIAYALGWIADEPYYKGDAQTDAQTMTRTYDVNGVQFVMCEVPGGKFSIGATPEQGICASFDERPSVEVSVDTYYIGETPVTQALWNAIMPENPSHFVGNNLPVERVTWDECQEFVQRLSLHTGRQFRLPTEAEWEYAARGGSAADQTKYAGADDDCLEDYVWYKENSQASTHDVKTKSPNALGLYDMSGNVSEWCQDWYFGSYAIGASTKNPQGPAHGQSKVVRGGSWNDKAISCRVSKRNSLNPNYRSRQIGFRIVLDA